MSTIVNTLQSFDVEGITYTMPKKVGGHYSVCAQYADQNGVAGGKMYFQTPKMKIQSDFVDQSELLNSFVDVVCEDESFIKGIKEFDDTIFNTIKEKRSEWFPNKTIDDTFLEVGQTHSLMKNNVIRAHVDKGVQLFDLQKESVTPGMIVKNSTVRCIFQYMGVWFTTNRWGITWNIVQMLHYPDRQNGKEVTKQYDYMFPDEEHEELHDDDTPTPPPGV